MRMSLSEGVVSGSDLKVVAARRRKIYKAAAPLSIKEVYCSHYRSLYFTFQTNGRLHQITTLISTQA